MRILRLRCLMSDGGIIGRRSLDTLSPLPRLYVGEGLGVGGRIRHTVEEGVGDEEVGVVIGRTGEVGKGLNVGELVRGVGNSGLGGSCGVVGPVWAMG